MPTLFIPREREKGETRIAATPETVRRYVKKGIDVRIEAGAGLGSHRLDADFVEAGAQMVTGPDEGYACADMALKVGAPDPDEAALMPDGLLLAALLWPLNDPGSTRLLAERRVTAFSMDRIPRITRAQRMDALSSQSNIAGYKAVLLAADALPRLFPLMMTAAGTITPAQVVIMGAGVAGLQAIATARRLGAVVEVSDVRPAVKEQVESLGGRFIEVETDETLEDEGGYAKEASAEFLARQQAVVRQHVVAADVVITTALVPGKKAPILITGEMVEAMRSGSVIVDLAVEQGGNCELSIEGEVVERHGVTLIGHRNLPAMVPYHSSDVYARNMLAVVEHFCPEGEIVLDFDDEITAGAVVAHAGEVRMELPPRPEEN